ncbi:hypothetical protein I0C86_41635 [Plantactinospora sp. S1510]|uniref:Ryanodine receptor Ryr domain-containing protein n=1 Tax=Plantactinospora alkalitolerans TaxID=2789879 RepID=A0ABS0HA55_9ACTN|nr:RyR domain-containing protein [Plantactinospora alkalitolerans]MBF9135356.1 hypothetical protein [Plantactinospora alkalitolerans]
MSAIAFALALVDRLATVVHNAWMRNQQLNGRTSTWSRLTCQPLMVAYHKLHEADKEVDRGTVRAVLQELVAAGHAVALPIDENNPPPTTVKYVLDADGHLWARVEDRDLWNPLTGDSYPRSWAQLYGVGTPITVLVAAIPLDVER